MDEAPDDPSDKAQPCFEELREIIQETRQSFDIWKTFACSNEYLCGDTLYHVSAYNPLFYRTVNAHLQSVFVNLFILGDKGSHNCQYLFDQLCNCGLFEICGDSHLKRRMEGYLRYTAKKHKKVRVFRNKYYAHRDRRKTMDDLLKLATLNIEEISDTISAYYRFIERAAVLLSDAIQSEEETIREMKRAMNDAKPLFDLLPSLQNKYPPE